MSVAAAAAFNLLLNAALSFAAGLAVTLGVLKLCRVPAGGLRLYLLSLPFGKILYDLARWIPYDSVLWTRLDPLALTDQRTLRIWAGLNDFGPYAGIGLHLTGPHGERLSASAADVAAAWLARHLGPQAPALFVAVLLAVSLALITRRLAVWLIFERRRRAERARARSLGARKVGWRAVDVYLAPATDGVPFTGGFFRPYVCVPAAFAAALGPEELEAAVRHELAHVRHADAPQALLLALLGDLFWFVPGYRWLKARLDDVRERLADAAAVKEGAAPLALASALLRAQERGGALAPAGVHSALAKRRSPLAARIDALVTPAIAAPAALGPQLLVALLTTTLVLATSFAGNTAYTTTGLFTHYLMEKVRLTLDVSSLPF